MGKCTNCGVNFVGIPGRPIEDRLCKSCVIIKQSALILELEGAIKLLIEKGVVCTGSLIMVEIESALTKWREVEKNEDLEGRAE